MIRCNKCGYQPHNESDLDLHHIVPKYLGGKDIDGRVYLCAANKGNDCHRKLHKFLNNNLSQSMKKITIKWLQDE